MQAGLRVYGSPVPAVEAVATDQVQRASDIAVVMVRHHQQAAVGHCGAEPSEELAVQIGPAPFSAAGVHVEFEKRIQRASALGHMLDRKPAFKSVAPFLAHCFALARGQASQEVLEGLVALIVPVELLVGALQQARGPSPAPFPFRQKRDVQRRGAHPLRQLDAAGQQLALA